MEFVSVNVRLFNFECRLKIFEFIDLYILYTIFFKPLPENLFFILIFLEREEGQLKTERERESDN